MASLDPIEGSLHADERAIDVVRVGYRQAPGCGIVLGITHRRWDELARVAHRGGLERGVAGRRGGSAVRGRLDRAGAARVGQRAERRGARFQRQLPTRDLIELGLVLLLVEQLPAGQSVDLGAQLRDPVFVAELHLRIAADQPGQHVVAECKVGRRGDAPRRHDDQRADHDPKGDRSDSHLTPAMHKSVVRPQRLLGRRHDGGRSAGAGMCRMMIGGVKELRPVRH